MTYKESRNSALFVVTALSLKEFDNGINSINNVFDTLKSIFDVFSDLLDVLGTYIFHRISSLKKLRLKKTPVSRYKV